MTATTVSADVAAMFETLVKLDADMSARAASLVLGESVDTDNPDDWTDRALCAQTDPEAFYPEKGGSTREAKKVCASCPVAAECLAYALANDERFGIWGGKSERERRALKKKAGR
jgi:WhiB family redox-sensing transcriptional regulator